MIADNGDDVGEIPVVIQGVEVMGRTQVLGVGERSRTSGFTMVEALVTVAVLAILVAITLPSFSSIIARNRLKSAGERLRADFIEARSEAQRRSESVFLSFQRADDGSSWCWGWSLTAGCDCLETDATAADYCFVDSSGGSPVRRIVDSSDFRGIRLDALPFTDGVIGFSPVRPTLESNNASFSSAAGQSIRLKTSGFGRVSLCSPTGASYLGSYPEC